DAGGRPAGPGRRLTHPRTGRDDRRFARHHTGRSRAAIRRCAPGGIRTHTEWIFPGPPPFASRPAARARSPAERPPRSRSSRLALYRADRELPYGLVAACEEEIEAWVYNRRAFGAEREWAPRTKAAAFAILKSFFDWATRPRHERMDWHPMLGLKPPKVPAGV